MVRRVRDLRKSLKVLKHTKTKVQWMMKRTTTSWVMQLQEAD